MLLVQHSQEFTQRVLQLHRAGASFTDQRATEIVAQLRNENLPVWGKQFQRSNILEAQQAGENYSKTDLSVKGSEKRELQRQMGDLSNAGNFFVQHATILMCPTVAKGKQLAFLMYIALSRLGPARIAY